MREISDGISVLVAAARVKLGEMVCFDDVIYCFSYTRHCNSAIFAVCLIALI